MGFTTQIFLFAFLPLCLIAYYGAFAMEKLGRLGQWFQRIHLQDIVLIVAGLGFYAWACFDDVFRLLVYVLLVYIFGELISKCRGTTLHVVLAKSDNKFRKYPLHVLLTGLFATMVVFCLVYSKYWAYVVAIWNWLFNTGVPTYKITAPLAISFLTFSAVSYLVDISRGVQVEACVSACFI